MDPDPQCRKTAEAKEGRRRMAELLSRKPLAVGVDPA